MSGSLAPDARLLVINAGSSSIKFSLYEAGTGDPVALIHGQVDGIGVHPAFRAKSAGGETLASEAWDAAARPDHASALQGIFDWLDDHDGGHPIAAAGHRVVFGGEAHTAPALVTPALMDELDALVPLMPLHLPANIGPIRTLMADQPALPQTLSFDTAFHATIPAVRRLFALPREFAEAGVKRYGFHGLSYAYIASVLPEIDPEAASGRTIVAHLGNGASLCALEAGRSVETSMGFSALEGLMMGTRPGRLDPGVLLYLIRERGMDADALDDLLYKHSGLLGVSGVSNDMRDVLASDTDAARQAVELFCYRATTEIGGLAAALGGLDALVFTGGIGEHSAPIREGIMRGCGWLGLEFDPSANAAHAPMLSVPGSNVRAYRVPTDEDLVIARDMKHVLTA